MGTTADKLSKLINTKTAIKNAIVNKGVAVEETDSFKNYVGKIKTIDSSVNNTLKFLLSSTKTSAYLFYFFEGTSVDDLISFSDTSEVTTMESMFQFAHYLTNLPLLDTSKVTNMKNMCGGCPITTIPAFDTSNVTDMSAMFWACKSIVTIPLINTSKVTNMNSTFGVCSNLTTIPAIDVSNVTDMEQIFVACSNLKSILMYGMKVSFDISSSTKFEQSDLVTILNNLETVEETKTLTMGSTNLAKLTDEDKAIATNKGWTLA